jgi:Mn2+/Fe2+ NRAMP family transporter
MKPDEAKTSDGSQKDKGISVLGRGIISGAADDDPSAIGTYASAGARFGPDILWTAPATLPMMFTVVYLSSSSHTIEAAAALLILLITSNRGIMGDQINSRAMNVMGWITCAVIFSASAGLLVTWFL